MNGNNGKNGNKNAKKEELDSGYEKNFDLYLYGCKKSNRELNDKAMYELARRLGTKVEVRTVHIDEPNELKIVYGLENDGEMIYHKEDERNLIEVEIASPTPKPQDNLFYIIHSFWPEKKSRGIYYEDSDFPVDAPKYITSSPQNMDAGYAQEVADNYRFQTIGFSSPGPGWISFEKKENLEKILEEKKVSSE